MMNKNSPYCDDIACGTSCWQEALEKLRADDPPIYHHLQEMLATQKPPSSRIEMSDQIVQSIEKSKKILQDRGLPLFWRNSMESDKARVRKAMDNIFKAVVVFRDMGSTLASSDPTHAGIAWAGVNLFLQVVLSGREQNAAALQGLAQISPIITRYTKVEELYIEQRQQTPDTKLNKDFKTQVVNLYASILVYQVAISIHSKRHTITQYARAIPKLDDWNGLLEDILTTDEECRNFTHMFDSEGRINQHHELKDILGEQDRLMESVCRQLDLVQDQSQELINRAQQHENMDILDWISRDPPNNDHIRILEHGKLNNEYASSGRWLFSRAEFQVWSNARDDSLPVLWLRGPVGTGKSSLVCLIVENTLKSLVPGDTEADRIAYFYCSKKQGTEEGSSPKTVLRSLLRQLSWSPSDLSIAFIVRERYRKAQQAQGYGGSELSADDCIELLTQLIESHDHHTKIVIDALDEAFDFDELLSSLERIKSSCGRKVNLLLSSRMNVPVQQAFPDCSVIGVGLDSQEDIEFFIKTEMKRNRRRLAQYNAVDLEDQMTQTLSNRAQGMFRWVELQLDTFFNSKSRIKRRDAFKRKLEKLNQEVGVPLLADVYDEIYAMNAPESQDRSVADRALKLVMCCQRPLSLESLAKGVSIDSNGNVDEEVVADYILDICSNFIILDHNQLVQFAHLSVKEYLTNGTKHGYTAVDAHTQAAHMCLWYLFIASDQDNTDAADDDELLTYATFYWPYHCAHSSLNHGEQNPLQVLLDRFLAKEAHGGKYARWIRRLPDALENMGGIEMAQLRWCLGPAESPIITACVWGLYNVVKNALSHGANPNERNSSGATLLILASVWNNINIVRLLLQSGADVNLSTPSDSYTALHAVFSHGGAFLSLELAKVLIDYGADIMRVHDGPFSNGDTVLHLATHYGSEEIIELVLAKGLSVDARNGKGSTALHVAAATGQFTVAIILLKHGAGVDLRNSDGATALQVAAANGSEDLVKLILKHQRLEPQTERWLRQAQFYNAVCGGDEPTVRILLAKGVDTQMTDFYGDYPLHWAAARCNLSIASLILERGADVDAKRECGLTALRSACLGENEEMIDFLLNNGADINLPQGPDDDQFTVLGWAIRWGRPQLAELLLKRGADPQTVSVNSIKRASLYVRREDFESALELVRSRLAGCD